MNRIMILDTMLALVALLILGPGASLLAREATRQGMRHCAILVRSRAKR